ncbi:fasciclin domain-containing protein [Nakamurella flava]|uniref:Fasciclin domain-containing protein n=1 Tax=Nakamurella flava TaxID=2576308 RepID=A0A4U6QCY6_9ACTN|nr:fasciclin domain-containing protein [Nakamurella flava]TKV57796.1 fasciclin domain-containing protein [Nakamurella flava]
MAFKRTAGLIAAAGTCLVLAACGGGAGSAVSSATSAAGSVANGATSAAGSMTSAAGSAMSSMTSSSPSSSSAMASGSMSSGAMAEGASLVGPGCADYAAAVPSGAGSVEGMAADPVATAASNNPLLKTLTAAVSGQLNPQVNLVNTLNGGEFTVFAPVDEAFAKVPAATLETLKTDSATLTSILTYHVVSGQLSPDQVVGEHTTVEGKTLTVTGSGDSLKVNDANVICGGVKTANATVYLIDGVLTPPAS